MTQVTLASIYALLAWLAQHFIAGHGDWPWFFPATGMMLGFLLLLGWSLWPGLSVGVLASALFATDTLDAALTLALGHILGPAWAAWLLLRLPIFNRQLAHPVDFILLVLFGAGLGSLLPALANLWVSKALPPYADALPLLNAWSAHALGIALISPLIIVWRQWPRDWFQPPRLHETLALFSLAILVSLIPYLNGFQNWLAHPEQGYWVLAFMAWAAWRRGVQGSTLLLLLAALPLLAGFSQEAALHSSEEAGMQFTRILAYLSALAIIGIGIGLASVLRERECSLERLQLAQAAAQTGSWEWHLASGQFHWSPEVWNLYQLAPDTPATLNTWMSVIHPADRSQIRDRIQQLVTRGEEIALEWRLDLPENQVRWLLSRGRPMRSADGRAQSYHGIVMDITDRKTLEAESRLKRFLEMSPAAIAIIEPGGKVHYLNPTFIQLIGYRLEQIPHLEDWWPLAYPDPAYRQNIRDIWDHTVAQAHSAKDPTHHFESRARCADGSERWLETHASCSNDELFLILIDITARHQATEQALEHTQALELAESRIRLLLNSSADGLYGMDPQGRFTFINPAACAILGYAPTELIGLSVHETIHHHHADGREYPRESCPMHSTLNAGLSTRRSDEVFWRRDGSAFPVAYASEPLHEPGNIVGIVVSFTDLTAQREIEQAREAARSTAERLARIKSEFLANMSHEIRTPLNAVLGLTQIGMRDSRDHKTRDLFERIHDAGHSLLGVVNDILDFSKIEAGKLLIESVPIEPRVLLDRAIDLVVARVYANKLDFLVEVDRAVPERCLGDGLRIVQILTNLLSNAVKFTAEGRVTLCVSSLEGQLIFSVSDTGIGITQEQLSRLFNPFEQADDSTTRCFGGTGLGLSISQRLAALMSGSIQVTSTPGRGSCFQLHLPLQSPTPAPAPGTTQIVLATLPANEADWIQDALRRQGATVTRASLHTLQGPGELFIVDAQCMNQPASAALVLAALQTGKRIALAHTPGETSPIRHLDDAQTSSLFNLERPLRAHQILALREPVPLMKETKTKNRRLTGIRILAAEDNEINRVILEELLGGEGAQVICVEDGQRCLDQLHADGANAYHVVLTDIQMPVLDGFATARRIRREFPALPIIGLTAHAMAEEREQCLRSGMNEHVGKPFYVDHLVTVIQRLARSPDKPKPDAIQIKASQVPPSPVTPISRRALMDWEAFASRYGKRPALGSRLIELTLQQCVDLPEQLRELANESRFSDLIFKAHNLKGIAGNLQAPALMDLASRVEMAARAEQANTVELVYQLADAVVSLSLELRQQPLLPGSPAPGAPSRADAVI